MQRNICRKQSRIIFYYNLCVHELQHAEMLLPTNFRIACLLCFFAARKISLLQIFWRLWPNPASSVQLQLNMSNTLRVPRCTRVHTIPKQEIICWQMLGTATFTFVNFKVGAQKGYDDTPLLDNSFSLRRIPCKNLQNLVKSQICPPLHNIKHSSARHCHFLN